MALLTSQTCKISQPIERVTLNRVCDHEVYAKLLQKNLEDIVTDSPKIYVSYYRVS